MAAVTHARLELVNALRGLGAVIVVFYHVYQIYKLRIGGTSVFQVFAFGHAGVDIFFVLSGFIIYYVHRRDIGQPHRLGRFSRRRLLRIYPTYWLITVAVVVIAVLVPGSMSSGKLDAGFVVASLALWPLDNQTPILPQAWTLWHEMKFYIVFGLVILLPRRLSTVLVTLAVVGSLANYAFYFSGLNTGSFNSGGLFLLDFVFHPYNLHFVVGALCAHVVLTSPVHRPRAILLCGLAFFGVAAWAEVVGIVASGIFGNMLYGIGSIGLVLGAAGRDLSSPPVAIPRAARFLGESSYALYLVHVPLIVLVAVLLKRSGAASSLPALAVGILMLAVCLVASSLFHALGERPLLRTLNQRRLPLLGKTLQGTTSRP